MSFPNFDYCILCDIVRPELGGKSILLGFYGLAPHVEITVNDLNRPVVLSLLAGCPPPTEPGARYEAIIMVTRPDGIGIFQTPPMKMVTNPDKRIFVPQWFNIAPPVLPGRYSIQITINGEVKLDTSFSIRPVTPPDVNRTVPSTTAPN